jgi:predicted PurR-regulated permease PerM
MTVTPDAGTTVRVAESPQTRSVALIVIAIIATFTALYVARSFFIPVALALLLNLVLSPLVRWLSRLHVPAPAAAALVLLVGGAAVGAGAYGLATPVRDLIATGPATLAKATRRLQKIAQPVERVSKVADQVEHAAAPTDAGAPKVVVQQAPSLRSRAFGTTETLLSGLLEIVLLLYALLAVGDLFLEKIVDVLPRRGDREKAIRIAQTMESSISSYLLLTALINVGEGLVVVGVMALLGMPTPFLWGALVALAEFIPYLGMLAMAAVIGVASLTSFDSVSHALLAPAAYVAINFIQGNVVTPLVMSRRLTLNPVVIFLALALWWWMWGIAGVFLAVPMLAVFKICCDHIESLASIGAFLGDRDATDQRSIMRARLVRVGMARPRH